MRPRPPTPRDSSSPPDRRVPRSWRARGAIALIASLVLVGAVGCGGGSGNDQAGPSGGGSPQPGGGLEIMVVSDLSTTDPFGSSSNQYLDNTRMNALYDSLFWSEPGTGKVMPQIGQSLTPEPGNTVWTLKLRPGVTFTDGTPYDAGAVKWTWDEHKNPERRSLSAGAAQTIKQTTVVDALTLRVELAVPNANFDRIVASSLAFIPSPTAFQKDSKAFITQPVGAGPFTLAEWTRGSKLVLKKNPGYWQGAERPYLDTVTFRVASDSDQSLNAVASDGAQLKVSSSATDAAKARARGLTVQQVAGITGESVVFNSARAPFDDLRARRAVALALNAAELNKVAFNGQGTPATNVFPPGSPLVEPNTQTSPETDKAEAQRLLDELAAEGKPLTFTFTVPANNQSAKVGEYIAAQLQLLKNITVRTEAVDIGSYAAKIRINRTYDASLQNWLFSDPEPSMYSYLRSGSATNYLGYASPAMDAALDQGRTSSDPAVRRAAYTTVTQQLKQDVPLWTYQQAFITAYANDKAAGILLTNDGMLLMDRLGRSGR